MSNSRNAISRKKKANRRHPPRRNSSILPEEEDRNSLEARLVELAMKGKIAPAAAREISAQRKNGLPIVFLRGDKIIKRQPNGKSETIGEIIPSKYTVPKHVRVLPNR